MRRYVETFFRLWFVALIPLAVLPVLAYKIVRSTPQQVIVSTNVWMSQASAQQLTYADPNLPPAQNAAIALSELLQTATFDTKIARGSPLYWSTVARMPNRDYLVLADLSRNVQATQAGPNLVAIAYATKVGQVGIQLIQSLIREAPREIQTLNRQQAVSNGAYYVTQVNTARTRLMQATGSLDVYMNKRHIRPDQMALQSLFDPRFATLYQATQSAQADVQNAEQQLSQASTQGIVATRLQVVDPPTARSAPMSKRQLLMQLALVAVAGFLLCGALIVGKTALDRSLRYPDEVAELLDLPVLTTVPYSHALVQRRSTVSRQLGDSQNGHVGR